MAPLSFQFNRSPQGLVGCTVGLTPGLYLGGFGDSVLSALHAASGVASQFADMAAAHPELMALVPGGAQAAIALKAISAASAAARSGASMQQVAAQHGPKVASVVRQILARSSSDGDG